jgi:hypothetical protein
MSQLGQLENRLLDCWLTYLRHYLFYRLLWRPCESNKKKKLMYISQFIFINSSNIYANAHVIRYAQINSSHQLNYVGNLPSHNLQHNYGNDHSSLISPKFDNSKPILVVKLYFISSRYFLQLVILSRFNPNKWSIWVC